MGQLIRFKLSIKKKKTFLLIIVLRFSYIFFFFRELFSKFLFKTFVLCVFIGLINLIICSVSKSIISFRIRVFKEFYYKFDFYPYIKKQTT